MHKPTLLVFSLLLSSSVCLVGMEGKGLPPYVAPPSVLGFHPTSQPQRLGDSPGVRRRIEGKKQEILALIAKIRDGYQLPEIAKGSELRKAQAYGLREELERAIADQQKQDEK